MRIFWSWQNDSDPDRHRWFIMDALKIAIAQLTGEYDLDPAERPELDHDTKDEPGMAEITAAILDKISKSAAFVADLTPIARAPSGKALPNPNVLIELGWALKMPGWKRLIAVINLADGFNPDDLPFDIRHRRALTYNLPTTASGTDKKVAKAKLAAALAAALRKNLDTHLADVAEEMPLVGTPYRAGNRSIWQSNSSIVVYNDSLGVRGQSQFIIPDRPRAYARLIPSGWTNGIPSATEVESIPNQDAVRPSLLGVASGDFGFCNLGFLNCWFTGSRTDPIQEAGNVAMYFDETGEYWAIDSTAIFERRDGHLSLSVQGLLRGWSDFLDRTAKFYDTRKAYPMRKLELGIVGLDGVMWPGEFNFRYPVARKNQFLFESTRRDWTPNSQTAILEEVYNRVRDTFGIAKAAAGEAAQLARS